MTPTLNDGSPLTRPPTRRHGGRWLAALAVLIVLSLICYAAIRTLSRQIQQVTLPPTCTATALGNSASLDPEQAGNAATISAIAVKRGLPGRAATIGIATAIQESKLRNIDYGDRDSVGLFQQRPSQGWGTVEQIMDPVYASNAFYDVLVKVEGYQSLPITQAAQKVQRSAFPSAYADHEYEARIFASALSGHSPAGLSCRLGEVGDLDREAVGAKGLTPRAASVAEAARRETGRSGASGPWFASAADAAASGSGGGSGGDTGTAAQLPGTTLRFTAPKASATEKTRQAWTLAHWALARAEALNIVAIAVEGKQWRRSASSEGWTSAPEAAGSTVYVQVAPGQIAKS